MPPRIMAGGVGGLVVGACPALPRELLLDPDEVRRLRGLDCATCWQTGEASNMSALTFP